MMTTYMIGYGDFWKLDRRYGLLLRHRHLRLIDPCYIGPVQGVLEAIIQAQTHAQVQPQPQPPGSVPTPK